MDAKKCMEMMYPCGQPHMIRNGRERDEQERAFRMLSDRLESGGIEGWINLISSKKI